MPDTPPAPTRPSATVILIRDAKEGAGLVIEPDNSGWRYENTL